MNFGRILVIFFMTFCFDLKSLMASPLTSNSSSEVNNEDALTKKKTIDSNSSTTVDESSKTGNSSDEKKTTRLTKKRNSDSQTTKERRAESSYFALASYSPIDLIIPGKLGLTLGLISDNSKSWELEYLRASISVPFIVEDLGKMTDQRLSLIGRSYFGGNSFNVHYGLSYFDFAISLGDKLLNRVSAGVYPALDVIQIQSLGFNLGIGNRWIVTSNITFGIDWISWSQPVYIIKKQSVFLDYATNQADRNDVENGIKLISYFPRIALLKLQLGMTF